mgnify:CR=1 FL=1
MPVENEKLAAEIILNHAVPRSSGANDAQEAPELGPAP